MNCSNDNQTTLDCEYADPLAKRLINIRKKIMDLDAPVFYLGDPTRNFKYKVVWKQVGNGNQLVTKESVMAVEKYQEAQWMAPYIDHSEDAISTATTDVRLEQALLSAIVFIDFDDCWLAPCGYWKSARNATNMFKDLKLSFNGKAPAREFLSQDFATVIESARSLMLEPSLNGAESTGFLVPNEYEEDAIRLQHVVFEVNFFFLFFFF
jgi:hypothetical protein